jgi:hypothetical protein
MADPLPGATPAPVVCITHCPKLSYLNGRRRSVTLVQLRKDSLFLFTQCQPGWLDTWRRAESQGWTDPEAQMPAVSQGHSQSCRLPHLYTAASCGSLAAFQNSHWVLREVTPDSKVGVGVWPFCALVSEVMSQHFL